MLRFAILTGPRGNPILFAFYVRNDNIGPKRVTLKPHAGLGGDGEPVITIMLPDEDWAENAAGRATQPPLGNSFLQAGRSGDSVVRFQYPLLYLIPLSRIPFPQQVKDLHLGRHRLLDQLGHVLGVVRATSGGKTDEVVLAAFEKNLVRLADFDVVVQVLRREMSRHEAVIHAQSFSVSLFVNHGDVVAAENPVIRMIGWEFEVLVHHRQLLGGRFAAVAEFSG